MGETFYTALGVDPDADTETIQRAYRELVKDHHPDVSDDADAAERFKRLTEARDVLVDASRRSRYDRVGHAAYVRRHLDSNAWSVETDDAPGRDSRRSDRERSRPGGDRSPGRSRRRRSSSSTRRGTGRSGSGREYGDWSTNETGGGSDSGSSSDRRRDDPYDGRDGSAWASDGVDWEFDREGDERGEDPRERARADGWRTAHAADGYSPSGHDPGAAVGQPTSTVERLRTALGKLGPWLAFHFAFLVSAFVTVWLLVTWTPSVTSVFLAVVLLAFTVFFSILHMVSRVYT